MIRLSLRRPNTLRLNLRNHLLTAFGCGFANLGAIQNGGIRIGFTGESARTLQDGAEMFAALNAVTARVHYLTAD